MENSLTEHNWKVFIQSFIEWRRVRELVQDKEQIAIAIGSGGARIGFAHWICKEWSDLNVGVFYRVFLNSSILKYSILRFTEIIRNYIILQLVYVVYQLPLAVPEQNHLSQGLPLIFQSCISLNVTNYP